MATTTQFKQVSTPSGKRAFEAYTAVWTNDGKNVAISAPTLEALAEAWHSITGLVLDGTLAQATWIVKANT